MAKSAVIKQRFAPTGNVGVYTSVEMDAAELTAATMIDGHPIVAYAVDPDNPFQLWIMTTDPAYFDDERLSWMEVA
ncbi:MAG: hypothetical protein AB7N71_08095 [Phycisphaerae bacterium]